MANQDPMAARRRLRDALRRLRENAGYTQKQVAEAMDWSLSKLIRIETGQVNVSTNDLRVLLQHYALDDPQRVDELLGLAKTARERAWWSSHRTNVAPAFREFLGYETSASVIRNFEPMNVPGLLQTPDYAREVLTIVRAGPVEELVDLRMERQEVLTRPGAPQLHFIVDESVLHRVVGGPTLMRRQLRRMLEVAAYPNVTLRVVPFAVGFYRRYRAAYVHFEFEADVEPDVLYTENHTGEMIFREAPEAPADETPAAFLEAFWEVEQLSPASATPALIAGALDRISPSGAP